MPKVSCTKTKPLRKLVLGRTYLFLFQPTFFLILSVMETLLALEAMDGATDIDFSSEDDDEEEVEEYLTSLASFSGSIAASLTSFSLSLLDRCLCFWVGGLGGEAGFSRGGSSAFSSLSLLGLELLLLDDFNFSLTFPTRPVGKVPFDFMSISILHVRCMSDADICGSFKV